MKRPQLNEVPLPSPFPEPGHVYVTMSHGQWDTLLDVSYKMGHTLLEIEEVDGCEKVVRAYRSNNVVRGAALGPRTSPPTGSATDRGH